MRTAEGAGKDAAARIAPIVMLVQSVLDPLFTKVHLVG
jgi:hypothetical protein